MSWIVGVAIVFLLAFVCVFALSEWFVRRPDPLRGAFDERRFDDAVTFGQEDDSPPL